MDATEQPSERVPAAEAVARPVRFWISLALLSAVIFVYVLLMTNRTREPRGTTGPAIGRRLGHLQLDGLTGGASPRTLEDLQGRVTLLNFWGTWCPPCIREFPQIVDISQRFANDADFQLLAVSCGQGRDEDPNELGNETKKFLLSRNVTLPTYADPQGATRQAMTLLLDVEMGYPTTLVLDRQAVIRGFWQGYDPGAGEEMAQLIADLLTPKQAAKD
jgi:thiol-disulfide isomerase/thioredoxin